MIILTFFIQVGYLRYHLLSNRYKYLYFYLCTRQYQVPPIPFFTLDFNPKPQWGHKAGHIWPDLWIAWSPLMALFVWPNQHSLSFFSFFFCPVLTQVPGIYRYLQSSLQFFTFISLGDFECDETCQFRFIKMSFVNKTFSLFFIDCNGCLHHCPSNWMSSAKEFSLQ